MTECSGCGYTASVSKNMDCQDLHDNCRSFALRGECIRNPVWMLANCQRSCGVCLSSKLGDDDESCSDQNTACPVFAQDIECYSNPAYMSQACPESCHFCVNATKLKELGVSDDDIQRRYQFSKTDFGLWQAIPQKATATLDPEAVKLEIKKMELYARQLPLERIGPGTACNNLHHDCVKWKVEQGGCFGKDFEFFLEECSLACQFCDVVEEYHKCNSVQAQKEESQYPQTSLPFNFLGKLQERLKNNEKALIVSSNNNSNGEWVASIKKSTLWKSSSNKKNQNVIIQPLLEQSKDLNWNTMTNKKDNGGGDNDDSSSLGRFVTCKTCGQEFKDIIAKYLNIQSIFLDPLEFVHYQKGQRRKPIHDFEIHDHWKASGHAVLTIFVVLQAPDKGGAFGFPDLDWTIVDSPEVLMWPNIKPEKNEELQRNEWLENMKSEQLPVVEGELYGVYVRVREYPSYPNSHCPS